LLEFQGDLGEFIGRDFSKSKFISFLAPEKRGKSWWLQSCAIEALKFGQTVAFFSAGDMTLEDISLRWTMQVCQSPLHFFKKYEFPSVLNPDGTTEREQRKGSPLSMKERLILAKKYKDDWIRDGTVKFFFHPTNTLTVETMEEQISSMPKPPTVVILDYMDIMALKGADKDFRNGTNQLWMDIRSLSQKRECLLITATQGTRQAANVDLLSEEHASEDKRKLAHVTGMIGINQTKSDYENKVQRLNWIVNRMNGRSPYEQVVVSNCREIGQTIIDSKWLKR